MNNYDAKIAKLDEEQKKTQHYTLETDFCYASSLNPLAQKEHRFNKLIQIELTKLSKV